jgi:hypothetical protein
MPGKRLGEAGRARSTACEPRHGAPGRQRPCATGRGDTSIIIACPLACASVRACARGRRGDTGATVRACPPSDAPGRQTDRFCGSKPVPCSQVLLDRSVVSLEVRGDWLARDFTCLSSSHAFFFFHLHGRDRAKSTRYVEKMSARKDPYAFRMQYILAVLYCMH